MKRVLYLIVDDWACIYVDGTSVFQGHYIQPMEMLKLASKHGFAHADVADHWATPEDEERCYEVGDFPKKRDELKGVYK